MTDNQKQNSTHTSIQHLVDDHHKDQKQSSSAPHSKEGEPIRTQAAESVSRSEVIVSESEPYIEDKELEQFIEVKTDIPEIHPDLKKAGLQAIDTTSLDPRQRVHLPISDEKVMEGLDQPVSSSFRWLAEIAQFMLRRAHLALKRVHGKVIRVIKK